MPVPMPQVNLEEIMQSSEVQNIIKAEMLKGEEEGKMI